MTLDQHINVTLVVNNSGLTQQGFGTIARLVYNPPWSDASRTYRRKSEAIADGFASDGPEIRFLNEVFSQRPRPPLAKLIRGTRPPTQRYSLAATAVNLKTYEIDVSGQGVTATAATFTSDSAATVPKIHNGLLTALNAVVGRNYLATFSPAAFTDFTYTVPDPSNDQLHAVGHNRQTGDGPIQLLTATTQPGGTALLTNYWLIRVDADNLYLADSLAHALAGTRVDVTTGGVGAQTIQHQAGTLSPSLPVLVTATSAGAWFSLQVGDTSKLSIVQDHIDPGISADLDDVVASDNDWYYLSTTFNSKAMVMAAAAAIEGMPFKFYAVDVVDSASESTAPGGGDVGDAIRAFGYTRTVVGYHRKPDEMWSDGWMGALSSLNVGSWTAAYKTIPGATPDSFVSNQTTNLDAKRMSYYKVEAGRSITWRGLVGSTTYGSWDVTVSLDFVLDLIQKRAFGLLVSLPKLPYTDEGISMMRGAIQGAIDVASSDAHQIVALGTPGDPDDPAPTVTFPRVKDISPDTRALHQLPDGDVFFRLQGAIETVSVNVSVIF